MAAAEKIRQVLRITAIVLLLATGLNAVFAGFSFILDPSGKLLGMPLSVLKFSPFPNFLVPGIVLFTVNGIFNLVAALLAIFKWRHHWLIVSQQGLLLIGWIGVQIAMLQEMNGLHLIMLAIGICLLLIGLQLRTNADISQT